MKAVGSPFDCAAMRLSVNVLRVARVQSEAAKVDIDKASRMVRSEGIFDSLKL